MEKVKNIFRALDTGWLIRHYIFAIAFITYFLYSNGQNGDNSAFLTIFMIISALLYPFAMFIYESIVDLILGDNVWILPGLLLLVWKIVRFLFILFLSLPIGIIGFIVLYFKVNREQ